MDKYILEDRLRFHVKNGEEAWTTVYLSDDSNEERQFVYCVLAEKDLIESKFRELGWSRFFIDFKPSFDFNNKRKPIYYRYGSEERIKPIIITRSYQSLFPTEVEIAEEFRLFFNIYVNNYIEGTYNKINEWADEDPIVKYTRKHIQIKTEYLKEYAAAQNLEILLIFEYYRNFSESMDETQYSTNHILSSTDEKINFQIDFQEDRWSKGFKFNTRLLGKKWLKSLENYIPQSLYDTIDKENFEKFIVKLDKSGKPILKSCNASYQDTGEANFLTPVYFKREVLRKYYEKTNRYEVKANTIHKIGGWYLPVDNNNKDFIVVYLGDLGRNLPYQEQTYWKHYNITNAGSISDSYYKSSIEGEYSSPELSEFIFKNNFNEINNIWLLTHGFELFINLHSDDKFHLDSLRLPLTDSANEFDSQVLSLIKLLVDSINEKAITKLHKTDYARLTSKFQQTDSKRKPKGLDKLQMHLEILEYQNTTKFIHYLRSIQDLRSASVAHRKGDRYEKVKEKFNIGEKSYIDIFDDILSSINTYLNELITEYKPRFV